MQNNCAKLTIRWMKRRKSFQVSEIQSRGKTEEKKVYRTTRFSLKVMERRIKMYKMRFSKGEEVCFTSLGIPDNYENQR